MFCFGGFERWRDVGIVLRLARALYHAKRNIANCANRLSADTVGGSLWYNADMLDLSTTGIMNENESIKRVYIDNSVVSGVFDFHMPERVEQSRQFWDAMQCGDFVIVVSDVLGEEQRKAPAHIRDFFTALPKQYMERIVSTDESNRLATEYIGANVISEHHMNDCKHIAIATITKADAVVSWNCDDMVNPNRIPKYNEVNKKQGYQEIEILTPSEFMEALL